jgi:hypothetical protein
VGPKDGNIREKAVEFLASLIKLKTKVFLRDRRAGLEDARVDGGGPGHGCTPLSRMEYLYCWLISFLGRKTLVEDAAAFPLPAGVAASSRRQKAGRRLVGYRRKTLALATLYHEDEATTSVSHGGSRGLA